MTAWPWVLALPLFWAQSLGTATSLVTERLNFRHAPHRDHEAARSIRGSPDLRSVPRSIGNRRTREARVFGGQNDSLRPHGAPRPNVQPLFDLHQPGRHQSKTGKDDAGVVVKQLSSRYAQAQSSSGRRFAVERMPAPFTRARAWWAPARPASATSSESRH